MNDESNTPPGDPGEPAAAPRRARHAPAAGTKLKCTVLVSGTEIGRLKVAKGHKCVLPVETARALAELKPARVRITGAA